MAEPIRVRTLDHVTIVVKDLEATRRFYVDGLGMQEVPRPGFDFRGKWFQAGPTQIHLIEEYERSGPAGLLKPPHLASSRTHHFAFSVPDGHAAAERARELGLKIVDGPKQRPDGAVQVFLEDPDGHVVELCSAGKA